MNHNPDIAAAINDKHQFIIQFDRCNGKDFKCYSVGTSSFRRYIRAATNYTEPDLLSSTDIITLCRKICGVNLSIGYHNEHSPYEFLDVMEWTNTLDMCRKWLAKPIRQKFCLPF